MVMRTFFVYAVVELAVLAALAWSIGLGWTLVVLLATSVVGVVLAGSQLKRQLSRLRRTRSNPQGAAADGMLVALGTVLVFVPGLVTTALGALMLMPPTRSAVRPLAGAHAHPWHRPPGQRGQPDRARRLPRAMVTTSTAKSSTSRFTPRFTTPTSSGAAPSDPLTRVVRGAAD